ncbi:class I SAM-dependent methyltransferase [Natronincola ferrireducens]|uniref:Methyltransferase domain-containing protein n=1 Tax=Natronincola ferrireducens TaxID=393762 RepID=A0A1G8ZT40_9FIRM|nr:class I SAM-dependent methyltransferase [Natronincola ferrireducens]SDK18171.1 Methyltransferase domain-containing protein [Natronincola ferrireducens]
MMEQDLNYWIEKWQPKKLSSSATSEFWNKRAKSYNRDVFEKQEESNYVIDLLEKYNLLQKNNRVLDIGCGPGKNTIPMAKKCEEVIALDISQEMLEYVGEHGKEHGLDNIVCHEKNWEDISLDEYGWEKKFDLVVASMTPGVYNFSTLKKMLDASKGYCYLSGFINRRDEIWSRLEKEILGEHNGNKSREDKIYYIFNILWNLGYHPEIHYFDRTWEHVWSLEETIDLYKQRFNINHTLKEEEIKKIEAFLTAHQQEGKVIEKTEAKIAVLIWKVE